jgi:thiol-disulfide isomerase/thioredoxin
MENGKPVMVEINIQVNFQIYDKKPVADAAGQGPAAPAVSTTLPTGTLPITGPGSSAGPAPAYLNDPKFQKALAEAKDKSRMTIEERLARWKNANKIAKNQCVECLHQMIYWQMDQAQWKDAIASATQLDQVTAEPKEKYFANSERGLALMHGNDGNPKPDQLKEAETSLRAALEIAPKSKIVVYAEGRALALMGRDEEAAAIFQKYVAMVGYSDSYRTRAEHFAENPRLAALPMAPPFTLTTSEGEQMSLDDMGGKVVLLDFWATWCGPCKEALPEIQRIAKDFAGQPLVVISISGDSDDIAWKTFIAKNHMTWPQFRDANGALRNAYGVSSIPRYFTIDTDGALKSVKVGSDADVTSDIRRLVGKARDAEKKKAKDSERAAAGE